MAADSQSQSVTVSYGDLALRGTITEAGSFECNDCAWWRRGDVREHNQSILLT
jgi:hypothetical protein